MNLTTVFMVLGTVLGSIFLVTVPAGATSYLPCVLAACSGSVMTASSQRKFQRVIMSESARWRCL